MFPFFILAALGIGFVLYSKSATASGAGGGGGAGAAKDTEALKVARRGWLGTTSEEVYQPPKDGSWTKTPPTAEWLAALDTIEKLSVAGMSKDPVYAPIFVLRHAMPAGQDAHNMGANGIVKKVSREGGVRFWEVQYTGAASTPFIIKPGAMEPTILAASAVQPPDPGATFFLIDDNFAPASAPFS